MKVLRGLGFSWHEGRWVTPAAPYSPPIPEADALHALLVECADQLMGCIENSGNEEELVAISEAIEAYEAKRWPEDVIYSISQFPVGTSGG